MDVRLRHAPTPRPDRIVLTWANDPATTQSVTWRTDPSVRTAFAEIVPAQRGPIASPEARRVEAVTRPFETHLGPCHHHRVRFTGLEPDRLYHFRVGSESDWSEWSTFRTAADRPARFRFLYLGDTQNDIQSQATRVARRALLDCPDARFVAHAGDLVDRGNRDDQWGEWFRAYDPMTALVSQLAVPGNHDYRFVDENDRDRRVLAEHWTMNFDFPECDLEGLSGSVYRLDVMGVRFLGLNSMERMPEQVEWIRRQLADNPNRWTIVMFHHPLFASGNERDSSARRAVWEPVFSEFDVDLALQGHDHTYARSGLVHRGSLANDRGTVYLTSVTGPKMYRLTPSDVHRSLAARTQLYQIVTVDGDRLEVVAKTATGEVHDAFAIEKDARGRKRLVEPFPPRVYDPDR